MKISNFEIRIANLISAAASTQPLGIVLSVMTNVGRKKITLADCTETEARESEIHLIIKIVEPDPEYQDPLVTDEATLLDAVGVDEATMTRRLRNISAAILTCRYDCHYGNLSMPSKRVAPVGLTRFNNDDAQQIVGRERRERVSQLD